MNENTAIEKYQALELILPDRDETTRKLKAIRDFQEVVKSELREGSDFGIIPGTDKPCLLQPGAQKISKLLNLSERFEVVETIKEWDKAQAFPMTAFPLFYYVVRCRLYAMGTETQVAEGMGECSSLEMKYRYRWIPAHELPPYLDPAQLKQRGGTLFEFNFALEKKETSGKYGKPPAYWEKFQQAIDNGTARKAERNTKNGERPGWEIDDFTYRVQNEDICDQVNTILKISCKRAFVYANLSVGRLSDVFTQDLEDHLDKLPEEPKIVKPVSSTVEKLHSLGLNGEKAGEVDPFDLEHAKLLESEAMRRAEGKAGHPTGLPFDETTVISPEQLKHFTKAARTQKKTIADVKAALSVLRLEKVEEIPAGAFRSFMMWAEGGLNNTELAKEVCGGGE